VSAETIPVVREYTVDLDLDFVTGEFRGTVRVLLAETVQRCRLNAFQLEVRAVDPAVRLEHFPKDEEIVVDLASPSDTFALAFSGKVAEKALLGLYWSRFGASRIVACQAAATGARRIFPCIDRPDRRAVVRFRLTTDDGLEAIFNTPVERESAEHGRRRYEFAPTPSMATYLVFLAVGRFDWYPPDGPVGRVRVAAPLGRAAAGEFAAKNGAEILSAFEVYYGIPYPLPKLDFVAVPEFAYGAMENWGAISFRDMRLLVDGETGSRQRRDTLVTIAHEIAHQWFGNLVTMAWWTDIWLNESFATFMEEKILERLHPTLGTHDEFLLDWASWARLGDSLSTTHPIHVPIHHPDEISEIFDEISYGKGASVLMMLEAQLGEEPFRAGVATYLQTYGYGNATSEDLWSALEASSGQPVTHLLSAWVKRPGLPVLEARTENGVVHVRQRGFRIDGHHTEETWPVPLGIYRDGVVERRLFEGPTTTVERRGARTFHLNPGGLGFYRVRYEGELLHDLWEAFPTLPSYDRWAALSDLYGFVFSGDTTLEEYLRFVTRCRGATDYLTVYELASQLGATRPTRIVSLGAVVRDTAAYLRDGLGFLRAQFDRLGMAPVDGEPDTDGILREIVLVGLLPFDDALAERLAGHFEEYDRLNPNLREPVALAYARRGGAEAYATLLARASASRSEGDLLKIERAFSAFTEPSLLQRALADFETPPFNRAHLMHLLPEMALNPAAREVVWEWLTTRLPAIAPSYKGTSAPSEILWRTLPFAALGMGLEAARAPFEATPVQEGERGLRKGLEWLRTFESLRARLRTN
jgi:tricorn protease interacting factor F2/3